MSKKNTCNKEIIAEISEELGIDRKIVEKIVDFQSKLTATTMKSGTFDGVRWPYFGVFQAKHAKVQALQRLRGLPAYKKKIYSRLIKKFGFERVDVD